MTIAVIARRASPAVVIGNPDAVATKVYMLAARESAAEADDAETRAEQHAQTALAVQQALLDLGVDDFEATLPLQAVSRAAMAAFTGMAAGRQAFLGEDGREGLFVWSSADNSALVTADPGQGVAVPPASDATGASGAWLRRGFRYEGLRPEQFGFVCENGATADNNTAWDRCWSLASSTIWRETHVAATPDEIDGIPIELAADKYHYSGAGVDYTAGGVTKCPALRGKGRRRTMVVIESDVFLLTWGDTSSLDVVGVHFYGGKGVFINSGAGNNVRDVYRVFDVRADGFTVCAFGSNSTDMPFWSVLWSYFDGGDDSIALAFSGNPDLCEVGYCEFAGGRYHIKVDRGGNTIRLHDNFHQNLAHANGARVWTVLTSESPNAGLGGTMIGCRFGNEGADNANDRPFLLAEEDAANDNFYDRYHAATTSSITWQGWHIAACVFIGDSGQTPALFTFYTDDIVGLSFTRSNKLAGSNRPYVFEFAAGITAVAAGSAQLNHIERPIDYNDAGSPIALCNLPGFAVEIDDPTDPVTGPFLVDDFMGGSTETGEVGSLGWDFSNFTIAGVQPLTGHPGIISLTSSAVAGTNCILYLMSGNASLGCFFNAVEKHVFVFREAAAGITDVVMRVGVSSNWGANPPGVSVYLEKLTTDTNWHLVTRVGGVDNRVDTGLAAGTTNWIKAVFRRVSGTDWRVSINGGAEIASTASSPTGTSPCQPGIQMVPSTNNARVMQLDYFSQRLLAQAR